MSIKPVQNQFNSGEISPLMDARFDLPAYQYSAAIMQNFIPISEGCYKRRGGTHFVASVKKTASVTFKIIPNPDYAVVTINGEIQNECVVAVGDVVSFSVSADNYQTKNGTYTVNEDTELEVVLVSMVERYNFAINATPDDALVIINDMQRKELVAAANSEINWSVSKEGYFAQSGTIRAIKSDMALDVALKMRFVIEPNPRDAIVVINGEERNFVDVDPNTEVVWSVSKEGYESKEGSETITSTYTKVVELTKQTAGQIMFESSTAGTYTVELEAGEYELLMCGAGGNGYSVSTATTSDWSGGSGAVFQGVINIPANATYNIQVGQTFIAGNSSSPDTAQSKFDQYIVCGGGYGGGYWPDTSKVNPGGTISILDSSILVSTVIATNGNAGRAHNRGGEIGITLAPLPDEYKNLYGYGGKTRTTGAGNIGGKAYVKLVYRG